MNPEPDYIRLHDLFNEFAEKLEELNALYSDSLAGYELIHSEIESHQADIRRLMGDHEYASQDHQDKCLIDYPDFAGREHFLFSMSPMMKQGDLRRRVEKQGENSFSLANMILVSVYTYWDEHLRIEIAKAMRLISESAKNDDATKYVLRKHLSFDVWGDIRHLRQSIVHHKGIAYGDIDKCKVLKWFSPGDIVRLDHARMFKIFSLMASFRNHLHALSLPPPKPLRIPPI